jgi:hypothetical protein
MDRRCDATGEGIAISTATRTRCPCSEVSLLVSGCFSADDDLRSESGMAGGRDDVTGGGRGEVGVADRGLRALVMRDMSDLLGGDGASAGD